MLSVGPGTPRRVGASPRTQARGRCAPFVLRSLTGPYPALLRRHTLGRRLRAAPGRRLQKWVPAGIGPDPRPQADASPRRACPAETRRSRGSPPGTGLRPDASRAPEIGSPAGGALSRRGDTNCKRVFRDTGKAPSRDRGATQPLPARGGPARRDARASGELAGVRLAWGSEHWETARGSARYLRRVTLGPYVDGHGTRLRLTRGGHTLRDTRLDSELDDMRLTHRSEQ